MELVHKYPNLKNNEEMNYTTPYLLPVSNFNFAVTAEILVRSLVHLHHQ